MADNNLRMEPPTDLWDNKSHIEIKIRDVGCGIKQKYLDKKFQFFP